MDFGGAIAMLLSIALSAAPPVAFSPSQWTPVRTRTGPSQAEQSMSVGRMVGGIASYASWPQSVNTLRICVVGATRYAQHLDRASEILGRPVIVKPIPATGLAPNTCDILYIGGLSTAAMEQMIIGVHGKPILTVAEADPDCHSGAMFCMLVDSASLTFRLNVDAISRSAVRVDPRVLRISEASGGTA